MAGRALEGLRVVELGGFISAPYAGKLLGDLGADVVKVEPPGGDPARHHGPFPGDEHDAEKSGLFLFLNANKRSVTLDLATDTGLQAFRRLLEGADVLVHNETPARMEALGLTWEALAATNPGLVMVSITPFGWDTPRRDWKGPALITTVASGICDRIGDPGRAPLWLPFCAADFQGGIHAAAAALAAVRARRASGRGQHAWLAISEVLATFLGGSALVPYVLQGQRRTRAGHHMPAFYPWEVVEVADGYFEVITMVDEQWQRFIELLGSPDWANDERLQNRWLAPQWAHEIDAWWHPWMRQRTQAELWQLFRERHIAFQPVQTIDRVAAADHLAHRGFWQEVDHPVAGRYRVPGAPYRLSASPWAIASPPPLLGQDNGWLDAGGWPARDPHTGPARPLPGAPGAGDPPLRGIRVLDHGHVWAGPVLGLALAELGAEVIRVNAPGRASGVAMSGVNPLTVERSLDRNDLSLYHGFDRGKRTITLDLTAAEGKELYRRLVAKSDVIIENFAPDVMPRLGLGYEALRAVNPGIILASLSATGATGGPWTDLVTYGPSLAALYGVKSLLGYHDDPKPREDTADLDPTAAGHALVAILAALEYRERTGEGQFIDMAQGEATIQRIAEPIMDYFFYGRVAGTQGNRYPGVAPHGIYRSAGDDEWIAIAARDETEWDALRRMAGGEDGPLGRPEFATLAGRLAHQDALDAAIEAWTSPRDGAELAARLQEAGVPAHAVMNPVTLAADENLAALRAAHLRLGEDIPFAPADLYQGVVWKLTDTPCEVAGPGKPAGSDNACVFRDLLGLDDRELERLRAAGII
jgi:crotonobetainyl-CoA:carnitine CoA-transferase CaiB-like acyl-CoA transferase